MRAIALVCGGLLLTTACTAREESSRTPDSVDFAWPGIWPQDSRAEAERAQEASARGDDRHAWQSSPDGERVVLRYARQELGWDNFTGLDLSALGRFRRWRLIRCGNGPNPDYPDIDCAPDEDRIYPAVRITLEQLLDRGEDGLWFITKVRRTELHQIDPADPKQPRRAVAHFSARRVDGAGAEEFLSSEGRKEFGDEYGENPLYSPAEGSPFEDYEIVFVDGPLWPFGDFEVGVRMILESGAALEDTLFVGPGRNVHGDKKLLVVHGLRSGLEGP